MVRLAKPHMAGGSLCEDRRTRHGGGCVSCARRNPDRGAARSRSDSLPCHRAALLRIEAHNLASAPHHIIPWMPYYAIVAAYPLARCASLLRARLSSSVVGALFAVVLGIGWFLL